MPVITKITQQKRDSERYNIFLDEEYAFSVHESVLVKFGLTKGMTLEDWSVDDMVYEDEIQKAFNRALHYLGFRMRSEHEVKQKLVELKYGEAVIMEAIVKLRNLGFLNDKTFSKALLETQKNTSGQGPRAIQQRLQQKGIDKDLQEKVLNEYSESEQLEVARKMAEKEARRNRTESPQQKERRIQNSLLRKGYSYDIIKDALSSIEFEIDEEEWDEVTTSIGEKAWRRYSSRYSGNELHQRVKRSMYQKGIPFDKIDMFIEQKELEEND
nr:recombination regulator RecX [Sporosarcina ureilytica]